MARRMADQPWAPKIPPLFPLLDMPNQRMVQSPLKYDCMTKERTMPVAAVRVQEKGQVTIPLEIRRKLGLKKGDLVSFVETDKGILIQPAEVIVSAALEMIGESLKAKGVTLDELIERGRTIRAELIKEEYGLTDRSA